MPQLRPILFNHPIVNIIKYGEIILDFKLNLNNFLIYLN